MKTKYGFIYAVERAKMEEEFKRMAENCRAEGKPEDMIKEIHRVLLEEFKSNRRFYTHVMFYEGSQFSDDDKPEEGQSPLMKHFLEKISIMQGELDDWLEEIDTPEIVEWLKALPSKDIDFLTLLSEHKMSQTEIAEIYGVSVPTISKRKKRLQKELIKILPEKLRNSLEM